MRSAVTLIAILGVAACGPTSTPGSSAPATPSPAGGAWCPDARLGSPSGEQIDLTGTWRGDDASYWLFTQVGNCVWATATDHFYNPEHLDALWQWYLRGTLQNDFTVDVEFASSALEGMFNEPAGGHAVLDVEFDGSGEATSLRKIGGCTPAEGSVCPPGESALRTTIFTLVDDDVVLPAPTPES